MLRNKGDDSRSKNIIFEIMKIPIDINCHDCHSPSFSMNGLKSYDKRNYQYKACKRQFIGDHSIIYQGCHSQIEHKICLMPVRGCGVRDIATITLISIGKILSTIGSSIYKIVPRQDYYQRLEVDKFWTYVKRKKQKVWLIYAYDRDTNKIVAHV